MSKQSRAVRKFERLTGIFNARQENEYNLPLNELQPMTPIESFIEKEAEYYLKEVGSVDRKDIIEHDFKSGMNRMTSHMGKFAEWVDNKSTQLEKGIWTNPDGQIWDGDIDKTVTTQELIDIYFESINKEK